MYEMGKMTKHKCDWKPTQLEAAIAAKELHAHTATILGNPNQFKPRYDLDRMTLREAVRTVMEVYKCCYKANEINAKDNPMLARRRLALQSEAIASAKWLQALQDVIRGQFHVDADKFWNWAEMTEHTLKKIKAWHEGDKKRYGETAALLPQAEKDFFQPEGNGSRLSFGGQRPPALC